MNYLRILHSTEDLSYTTSTISREVTTAQYNEFYKYIANAYDIPMHTLHFRADAPIDLKVLLYVPSFHSEKFGMGRIEAGKWREVCLSSHQEMHESD